MPDELKNLSGCPLSTELEKALEEFVKLENIAFVVSLPNIKLSDVEGCNPSGLVAVVDRKRIVDVSLLPENMFNVIAAFEIQNFKDISIEKLLDHFHEHVDNINSALGDGPVMDDIVMHGQRKNIGKDRRQWIPTLGEGTWTISEQKVDKFRRKYYVTVEVPHLKLSENFHEFVESQTPNLQHSVSTKTSMEDIYNSVEYRNCVMVSVRNAGRVAAVIANEIGLKLQEMPDLEATPNDKFSRIPTAMYKTLRNHLQPATIYETTIRNNMVLSRVEPGIAVFHEAGSMRESTVAMLPLSPLKGIALYNASSNKAVNSIPASIGSTTATREIDDAELDYIKQRFFWPSKYTSREIPQKLRASYKDEKHFLGLKFIQNEESRTLLKPLVTYFAK